MRVVRGLLCVVVLVSLCAAESSRAQTSQEKEPNGWVELELAPGPLADRVRSCLEKELSALPAVTVVEAEGRWRLTVGATQEADGRFALRSVTTKYEYDLDDKRTSDKNVGELRYGSPSLEGACRAVTRTFEKMRKARSGPRP